MQAQTSSSSGVTTGGPDSDVASVEELPIDEKKGERGRIEKRGSSLFFFLSSCQRETEELFRL